MTRSVPALFLALVFLAVPAAAQSQSVASPTDTSPQAVRLSEAVAHFNKAFYELTPQKRHGEAASEFTLAAAAFERVLADSPRSIEAHRYLARIHTARKDFKKAAEQYDRITGIEPLNIDAFAMAAQAYMRAGDFDRARARLLEARLKTNDAAALARLDDGLARLDALRH